MPAPVRAEASAKTELIERFLDHLIDPNECIDTFGRSYIEDLEHIVAENHEFDFRAQRFPDAEAQAWFDRIRAEYGFARLEDFINYVRANLASLNLANLRPRTTFHGETTFASEPAFQELKSARSVERSNEFQRLWSMRSVRELPQLERDADAFEMFMRYDRMNPWTYLVRREIARGNLARDSRVLCIGNRWAGEILYFRQTLGLRNAMGVDLVSINPQLVIAADMHRLPFPDGSVKLVFTRGTINKSYDVRLFARELLRVLDRDGFLIVETPGPFGYGVNSLGQTDVKSWRNLVRLFRGHVGRLVYADAMEPYAYQGEAKRLVRLFIQLDKGSGRPAPAMETFPQLRFRVHDWCRGRLLAARSRLRSVARRLRRLIRGGQA